MASFRKKTRKANHRFATNTAKVAKEIASQTGADILELKTVKKYPDEYKATTEEVMKEVRANERPALAVKIHDMAQYDTVFIGCPIWCVCGGGDAPMCVYIFWTRSI